MTEEEKVDEPIVFKSDIEQGAWARFAAAELAHNITCDVPDPHGDSAYNADLMLRKMRKRMPKPEATEPAGLYYCDDSLCRCEQ